MIRIVTLCGLYVTALSVFMVAYSLLPIPS